MKSVIYISLLLFPAFASAQDVMLSKKDLLDIVVSSSQDTVCKATTAECFGISISTCKSDIKELGNGKCSSHIPSAGAGMDKISELSSNTATCISKELVNKYQSNIAKNKDSAACQAFMK